MRTPTLDVLRRYAIARTLPPPATLSRAIRRLGFVQADPIRAPARAQDLTLRHRVRDYVAGDLERRYPRMALEEDCLVNYGFLPRAQAALLHPRQPRRAWDAATRRRAEAVLAFVRARGAVHPREVDRHFAHGRVRNYWGGSSNATTHLLEAMHYAGLLRVRRRDAGTRVYAVAQREPSDDSPSGRERRAEALVELIVRKYAPLPASSLVYLVRLLDYGAPQLATQTRAALAMARERLPSARVDGVTWLWPDGEDPAARRHRLDHTLRLLAPFDPIAWDRRRFELLWGWRYRFEAYTPAAKRQFGYYALPMLWRGHMVGWANIGMRDGQLAPAFGYAAGVPKDAGFRNALDEELDRMQRFLMGAAAIRDAAGRG
ncbi:DNA glycosylase AlkZ-like family protein [Luteimonas kalidii]|uniref:Crosslink repair DNA glycosylase YcaQ family protein n=1 Tax=Luteimonas kalidii TaxID=3042025 RepID=A0ABT6JS83_9GAMM|nr:crosslink repair DNA glycosylase YcaQ family protein [Luteimonas kalidii]MDH5833462.1 crosslink repair DNA glycosylase YcaQ family protein [Luteimonas kalidii]